MDAYVLKFTLEKVLDQVYNKIEPKTRNHLHTVLQRDYCTLANRFSLKGEMEYRVLEIINFPDKKGLIDVVWLKDKVPIVAIENESALKPKTMEKLLSSGCQYLYYVYYGGKSDDLVNQFINENDPEGKVIFIHKRYKLGKNKDFGITKEHYR
ncbi:hypothetical protein [Neobacillus niacini]|uniref:hypothetical protein n=1 Tax=Neobacillus niacini TaxID=86668 RepID=UPI0005EDFFBF|nr:hypothetical protein [Neobacillus niacini]